MLKKFNDQYLDLFDRFFEMSPYETLPKVKINKKDGKYLVAIGVPGLTKDDINITTDKGVLKISYEKEEKNESSYFLNSFSKSYIIPDDVNESDISAKIENGVLELILPISAKKLTERTIEIS